MSDMKPPSRKPRRMSKSKLDKVLSQQAEILKKEKKIEKLEKKEINLEKKEETKTTGEESELSKLEHLEQEVKKEVAPHPLTKVTIKDFIKGIIGAFVGVVVHFTFTYGVELAEHISMQRATFLLIATFIIGTAFLYGTGFRKLGGNIAWLLPYRTIVLYATAVLVTFGTLSFFYPNFFADPSLAYRQIAVVNLSAVIGACTADLIGRE